MCSATIWATTGCGTVVQAENYSATIAGATQPQQISIFDSSMGQSAEWAAKTLGTATSTAAYTATIHSTATKIVGDNSPPDQVEAGIALPQRTHNGYYALSVSPHDGQTTIVTAPFVAYYLQPDHSTPAGPLSVRVIAHQNGPNWKLDLEVQS